MTHYPEIRTRKLITDPYNVYEVIEDCEVQDGYGKFVIPAGFKTDFASIPRFLWSILPPHGLASIAAIAHDFRYTTNMYSDWTTHLRARHISDLRFFEDMIVHNVPQWQSSCMYQAVRWFGKGHWNRAKQPRTTNPEPKKPC